MPLDKSNSWPKHPDFDQQAFDAISQVYKKSADGKPAKFDDIDPAAGDGAYIFPESYLRVNNPFYEGARAQLKEARPDLVEGSPDWCRAISNLARELHGNSGFLSRDDVDFNSWDGLPGFYATMNMSSVVDANFAREAALLGMPALLHQFMSRGELEGVRRHLDEIPGDFREPVIATRTENLESLNAKLRQHDTGIALVTDADGRITGFVDRTEQKLQPPSWIKSHIPVGLLPAREPLMVTESVSSEAAYQLMQQNKVDFLVLVDSESRPRGIMTRKQAVQRARFQPFTNADGSLAMAVTLSMMKDIAKLRDDIRFAIQLGARIIVLDSPHAHNGVAGVEATTAAREEIELANSPAQLVVGNVDHVDAAEAIALAGAHAVKIGINPGDVCETGPRTNTGTPQLTTMARAIPRLAQHGVAVWLDGGSEGSGGTATALTMGAARVGKGSKFVKVAESASPLRWDPEKQSWFVEHWGMASGHANVKHGRNGESDQARFGMAAYRDQMGKRIEGAHRRIYLSTEEAATSLAHHLKDDVDGVTSAMTFANSRNLVDFVLNGRVGIRNNSRRW